MTGNWSWSEAEFSRSYMPEVCNGWLSSTTPRVGAELAQVGLTMFGETGAGNGDQLVTGILRERLPHVRIDILESREQCDNNECKFYISSAGSKWERFFTYCPWLNGFKATFFNSLIISKASSRKGVEYVGSIFNPAVWKYFICLHVEHLLEDLERMFPSMLPSHVWDVCMR